MSDLDKLLKKIESNANIRDKLTQLLSSIEMFNGKQNEPLLNMGFSMGSSGIIIFTKEFRNRRRENRRFNN